MGRRKGPPKERYNAGPECLGEDPCSFFDTCFGYVPPAGPGVRVDSIEVDGRTITVEDQSPIEADVLFLCDKPSPDDISSGRPMSGRIGGIFNLLLHGHTPWRRTSVAVAYLVRCRTVVWTGAGENQIPATREYNGDHVQEKPTPGQVRECSNRYLQPLLDRFQGQTIVALGKEPAQAMAGRTIRIGNYRGSIFEPGTLTSCDICKGRGGIAQKPYMCKECKGNGHTKCETCGRKTKHLKKCEFSITVSPGDPGAYSAVEGFPPCQACDPPQSGTYPKKPKKCGECDGSGRVPSDPDNQHVSPFLRDDQLLFISYSPSFLAQNPGAWEITRADFGRITGLRNELVDVQGTVYNEYPPPSATQWLDEAQSLSIDLETVGGLDPTKGDIQCVGATDRVGFGAAFDPGDERIPAMLRVPEIVGQNFVLYDWWWLHNKGFVIPESTRLVDTRYLGKFINPDTPNDLTYLSGAFAKPPIRGYWKTKQNYRDKINDVVCIDVDATLRVKLGQMEVIADRGLTHVVDDYIVPLSRVVFDIRTGGMKIDKEQMDDTRAIILEELQEHRTGLPFTKADGSGGTEGQHAKVQQHLYDTLALPEQRNRESHKRTADGEALEKLRSLIEQDHVDTRGLSMDQRSDALEFIGRIITCRDLSKLEGNFLRYKVNRDDFVHPALNMGGSVKGKHESGRGTATWRFSCSDPNAQQVPVRARNIFIPDHSDWEIASIDLKQAEVVGFLWYAEANNVLERVLKQGLDAHRELASFIVGHDASDAERKEYKNTTFALLYGEHEFTTAARLNRPVEEIRAVREHYFKMLPGAEAYRKRMISQCMNHGYVESPFGFRRILYLDRETGRAANQACNMPIQNIPPVVIGRAMIGMHRELPSPARIWMQVHDEVCLTYPKEMRSQVLECALEWLRRPVPELAAPTLKMASGIVFNLDVEVGPNWRDLTSINEELGL